MPAPCRVSESLTQIPDFFFLAGFDLGTRFLAAGFAGAAGLARDGRAAASTRATASPIPAGLFTTVMPARRMAARVAAIADKDDALEKSRDMLAAIRKAGAKQDYDLARLRMSVRQLRLLLQPGEGGKNALSAELRVEIERAAAGRRSGRSCPCGPDRSTCDPAR